MRPSRDRPLIKMRALAQPLGGYSCRRRLGCQSVGPLKAGLSNRVEALGRLSWWHEVVDMPRMAMSTIFFLVRPQTELESSFGAVPDFPTALQVRAEARGSATRVDPCPFSGNVPRRRPPFNTLSLLS